MALSEMGLSAPTEPQVKAIPPIMDGENVLLVAPTGSGKTEAALLPVFSRFFETPSKEGISIIYITPLRALNRDMLKRISGWAQILGLTVEVRHGDTATKVRRKQALSPPNMLLTTPETLQAILPGGLMKKISAMYASSLLMRSISSLKTGVESSLPLRLRD